WRGGDYKLFIKRDGATCRDRRVLYDYYDDGDVVDYLLDYDLYVRYDGYVDDYVRYVRYDGYVDYLDLYLLLH
ncbi:unnamed protein product, partial [Rotaria socialis]